MQRVIVIKQVGETGLRLPGTSYLVTESELGPLLNRGFVQLADTSPVVKERKAKIETKELKIKRKTKRKK